MTYFNGDYLVTPKNRPYRHTDKIFCDNCAETAIPLAGKPGDFGRHFDTEFRWAPAYGGGTKCHNCKKEC